MLVLVAGYAAIAVSVKRVVGATPGETPSFAAGLLGVGGLLAAVSWLSVLANRDAGSWRDAGSVGWIQLFVAAVIAIGAGAIGWFLAGGNAARTAAEPGYTPTMDVADPLAMVWTGRGIGKVTTAIGIAMVLIGVIMWGVTGLVLALVGIVGLAFAAVRVTIANGGVVVSMGWWGFPLWKVPLDTVTSAEVEDVRPLAYGGWGYRVRPGVRAVVVRAGESIRLVRGDGPDLVYTVDDATTGAGLINAVIGARQTG
jgi:hypothetical protein